jgi:hypothetical protein
MLPTVVVAAPAAIKMVLQKVFIWISMVQTMGTPGGAFGSKNGDEHYTFVVRQLRQLKVKSLRADSRAGTVQGGDQGSSQSS